MLLLRINATEEARAALTFFREPLGALIEYTLTLAHKTVERMRGWGVGDQRVENQGCPVKRGREDGGWLQCSVALNSKGGLGGGSSGGGSGGVQRRRRRFTALNEVFGGQILKVDDEQWLQGGEEDDSKSI